MEKFNNVNELVNKLKPVNPVYCIRPDTIKNSIKVFKDKFPGNLFLKSFIEFFMVSGRIQYTGSTGLSELTKSLTLLNFSISCVPH